MTMSIAPEVVIMESTGVCCSVPQDARLQPSYSDERADAKPSARAARAQGSQPYGSSQGSPQPGITRTGGILLGGTQFLRTAADLA
jgi:hypothetical protein